MFCHSSYNFVFVLITFHLTAFPTGHNAKLNWPPTFTWGKESF